jgi:hypothetical protein
MPVTILAKKPPKFNEPGVRRQILPEWIVDFMEDGMVQEGTDI